MSHLVMEQFHKTLRPRPAGKSAPASALHVVENLWLLQVGWRKHTLVNEQPDLLHPPFFRAGPQKK
jgi:hypothetical protein